jgi:hypothetical protein
MTSSPGGFVIVDDYFRNPGSTIHDFRDARNIQDPIMDIDGMGAYWRRNLTVTAISIRMVFSSQIDVVQLAYILFRFLPLALAGFALLRVPAAMRAFRALGASLISTVGGTRFYRC